MMPLGAPSALFGALIIITISGYCWLKYKFSYWKRLGIPQITPNWLFGNLGDLLIGRTSFGCFFQRMHADSPTRSEPVTGLYIFQKPALLLRNPALINSVLIKHFHEFQNRFEAADARHDDLGSLALPLSKYAIWHDSRRLTSELFTSGRLKGIMYAKILAIAVELEKYLKRQIDIVAAAAVIEVKEMCALFTTDATASVLFNMDAGNLKYGDSALRSQCRDLLRPNLLKMIHFFTIFFLPHRAGLVRAKVFSMKYSQFIRRLVSETLRHRKTSSNSNVDLIDLFVSYKSSFIKDDHGYMHSPSFIASQVAIFLLAGFETSSSIIAFALYELAKKPELQERLRSELRANFQSTQTAALLYSDLQNMTYLDMVVAETLRLYPAAAFINRECTPTGAHNAEGFSLRPTVDFTVPRGMPLYISILGLHRDPRLWPNPNTFDPDRFSPEKVKKQDPMIYMPFGAGPHGCIGSKVGILQVKLGLVYCLRNYRVETCPKTVPEIKFDPMSFMLQASGGIFLNFVEDKLTVR